MSSTDTQCNTCNVPHGDALPQALNEVFQMTCGATMTPIDCPADKASDGVVMAVISLVGDVEWSVFLGLPSDTAESIALAFAGFEIPYDSADMGDAVGEITNVFAGQVKAILDQRSVKADISLPSVIRADNMHVLIQKGSTTWKACFECEFGKLWIGVVDGTR